MGWNFVSYTVRNQFKIFHFVPVDTSKRLVCCCVAMMSYPSGGGGRATSAADLLHFSWHFAEHPDPIHRQSCHRTNAPGVPSRCLNPACLSCFAEDTRCAPNASKRRRLPSPLLRASARKIGSRFRPRRGQRRKANLFGVALKVASSRAMPMVISRPTSC
jgi:hypothetical protein